MFFKTESNSKEALANDYERLCRIKEVNFIECELRHFDKKDYARNYISLSNQVLIGNYNTAVHAWDIQTGKILSIYNSPDRVVQFIKITENIVVLTNLFGKVDFWSYENPRSPQRLNRIQLPENYHIFGDCVKLNNSSLALIASYMPNIYSSSNHLFKINFDIKNLSTKQPYLTLIANLPSDIARDNNPDFIKQYNENTVLLSCSAGLFLYNMNSRKDTAEKSVYFKGNLSESHNYRAPRTLLLNNGHVATVFLRLSLYFFLACWDLNKNKQEFEKLLSLPQRNSREIHLLFEDKQNQLILITDEITNRPCLTSIHLNSFEYRQYTMDSDDLIGSIACSFINKGQQFITRSDKLKIFNTPAKPPQQHFDNIMRKNDPITLRAPS